MSYTSKREELIELAWRIKQTRQQLHKMERAFDLMVVTPEAKAKSPFNGLAEGASEILATAGASITAAREDEPAMVDQGADE